MPRDFKSFSKDNKSSNYDNILNDNKEQANKYQDIIDKYKDMDQNELMQNLFSEATKLKQQGQLNPETLSSLKSTLSPFLNDEQKTMLNSLVKAINEQK